MERTKENFDYILRELDYYKDRYDLCGVEITEEDVESVVDLIDNGFTEDDAIDMLTEMGLVDPVMDEENNILTDEDSNIFTIE